MRKVADECRMPYINATETIDGNGKKHLTGLEPGWTKWDFDKCQKWNDTHPGNIIAINLSKTNYMVIDIDDPKSVESTVACYGEGWQTKSSRRGLPHLYRLKDPEDPCRNDVDRDGTGVDYLYTQIWEDPDGLMSIPAGETEPPVFEAFSPAVAKVAVKKSDIPVAKTEEDVVFKKRILDNIAMKHWENRETWRNLIYAMQSEEISEEAMEYYSSQVSNYEDGCVQELLKDWDASKSTSWGTVEHFSRLSNSEEHVAICANRPRTHSTSTDDSGFDKDEPVKLELDDLSLAKAFLRTERDNVCYVEKEVYIYRGEWRKDHKTLQLKNMIGDILVKQTLEAQSKHNIKMLTADADKRKSMEGQSDLLNKIYQRVASSSGIDKICNMVLQKIASTGQKIEFDIGPEQLFNLHFKNGCLELKTRTFRPRVQQDYVTQFLDWDYDPDINADKLAWVREMYRKIQPDPEQRKFMLAFLAYCLCGDTERQIFKVNIGYSASNGKSTEFKIHMKVFPVYSEKLPKNVFDETNTKRHKSMFSVLTNPIRFLCVEELSEKKLDADYIKDIVDGAYITCEVMYGTEVKHSVQAKLMTCSNKDFKADVDGGILRRGMVQHYNSRFRGRDEEVEDWFGAEKHHYEKDMGAPHRFYDAGYKNAYLALLLEHFDTNFTVPKQNKEAFKAILHENDEFQQYLDEYFVKTSDKLDRVCRDELMDEYFGDIIKKRPCTKGQFNTMMRARGFTWDKALRHPVTKKRGCFIGLRRATPGIDSDDEE